MANLMSLLRRTTLTRSVARDLELGSRPTHSRPLARLPSIFDPIDRRQQKLMRGVGAKEDNF